MKLKKKVVSYRRWSVNAGSIRLIKERVLYQLWSLKTVDYYRWSLKQVKLYVRMVTSVSDF